MFPYTWSVTRYIFTRKGKGHQKHAVDVGKDGAFSSSLCLTTNNCRTSETASGLNLLYGQISEVNIFMYLGINCTISDLAVSRYGYVRL